MSTPTPPSSHLNSIGRRRFLGITGSAGLALPFTASSYARAAGANERVRVAIIGCGSRGGSLSQLLTGNKDAQIVAICDADKKRMEDFTGRLKKAGTDSVAKIQDYRELIARDDIDAVIIATPNHWHTLQAIDAMKAGKAVYVEKPVSHNPWEGWQLAAAAKKYKGVIQAGFQNRSDPGPQKGIGYVQSGGLGKILRVHSCCFRNRKSIGKRKDPLKAPESVDYNLWLGPAADEKMFRPQFHYDWHWIWNTGDGDMGNQAPHELDMVNWLLGNNALPQEIVGFGGRFGWNDAGETPNLHTAWYEHNGIPVTLEVNDLCLSPKRNSPSIRDGVRVGIVVHCENGILKGGRGGMTAYKLDGKTRIERFPGDGGRNHMPNFLEAVRAGHSKNVAAPIEAAVVSSAMAHLANLSYRAGKPVKIEEIEKTISGNAVLETILKDQSKQLSDWEIAQPSYQLGSVVRHDPSTRAITGEGIKPAWIRPAGRGEFVIPEIKS